MVKESENGKRESSEKKVEFAERQQPSEERQQRSQDDLSQLSSSSSSFSIESGEGSVLNQNFHAASSHPSVCSNQQRLDSAATSVARDAVAKGAVIAIVENASKEAVAAADEDLSKVNGREANGRKKKKNKKVNDSNNDVDNSKDDGWRKVETKLADEKSISSLTMDSVFGRTEKPKRGDDYDGQQNKNKVADDWEANDGMESENSNYVCTPYNGGSSGSSSVTGKPEKGLKNGDEKENGKKTDDNSKEKKPETNDNNQENEVKRKKKVEPQKQPPTTVTPSQPESRPTSRPTCPPTCRPASKSLSRPTSPPKKKNVSIAGRNSAPPDSPSTWGSASAEASSARTNGYSSTAGSICTRFSKSKPEAEPEVTQPMPMPTKSPRTSKNVSIAADTPRYASDAPTQSQGSKGGSICTRFSVQSKPEPSTEANQAAVDDASKVTKASEGCDKERCSVYTPKSSLPPPSMPPPRRASQLLNNDKIIAVEGGEICTDYSEKPSQSPRHVQTTGEGKDDDVVIYVKSMESFQTDDDEEGSSTTTLLLSGLGLVGLLALLSRFWGGGKAPCIAGRHGLPLKVINISSECQMPVKLTATNCHLGLLNINAAKPDCSR